MNQYDAVKVKLAQKCDIKIKGLNKKYKGSIQKIGQVAKPKITGVAGGGAEQEFNVDVDIIINNVDNNIKSGYEADVDVIVDRKSTRLNSSHANISYAVFCLKKKKKETNIKSRNYLTC